MRKLIRELIKESINDTLKERLILEKGGRRRKEQLAALRARDARREKIRARLAKEDEPESGDDESELLDNPPEEDQAKEDNTDENDILKHYEAAVECIKDLRTWKFGTTKVVDKPFYAFMVANKGGKKVGSGTVKPSQGMGRHKNVENTRMGIAEVVLESVRASDFSDAISRKGSIFLTPYSNGGLWSYMGDTVFLVMIPPGSKVTYVDGQMASETSVSLASDGTGSSYDFMTAKPTVEEMKKRIPTAKKIAKKYWSGIHIPTYARAEEVITKANASVIAPINELPPFPNSFKDHIDHRYLYDYFED